MSESLRAILELRVSILLTFLFVICLSASNGYGVFCGRKVPSQVVYQTNADLIGSYEALVTNSLVKVKADMTQKGLLWFQFRDSQTVFLLSALGKLQVKWSDVHEKRILYRFVKDLLVAKPNEKLAIQPLKQQTWIEYPPPPSFKLYWCGEATEFVLKSATEKGEKGNSSETRVTDGVSSSRTVSKSDAESPRVETFRSKLENVEKALEELRHDYRFFREPTLNEVALKSGCLDLGILRRGLTLSSWKSVSEEEAKRTAEAAINLAGWLWLKEKGEFTPLLFSLYKKSFESASMSVIGKAQIILKNYPDLVPKVSGEALRWPDETKRKWTELFGVRPPVPPN